MEETGAVINLGTSLFIVSLVLVIAGCVALLLNAVLTGASSSVSYQLTQGFDIHPNANLTTIMLGILVMLHGIGYYCQYVKTPLSRCHLWLLITGSLTILVAAAAVLLVTRGLQLELKIVGYCNTGLTAMQLLALIAFGVCTYKSGCFGKCNSNARLVFYVVVGIYAVWLLGYIAVCAAHAIMHDKENGRSGGLDPNDKIRQSYKRVPCVNYALLIPLIFSAYQVNFCYVPITGTDWTFLLLFGTCAGILLSVVMHYQGGGTALTMMVRHALSALAAVLMAVILMYSYFKEPFTQIVPGKKYTPWDLVFIVLAAVLAGTAMAMLIKWDGVSHSNEYWTQYTLPSATVVCMAIELVMLHFGWVRGSSCDVVWQAVMVIMVFEWVATLAMIVIEASGGIQMGMGFDAAYLLMMFHLLLVVATLVVCHYRMPFPGKYQLWHWSVGLWDTMLVLLVLESLVVLVIAIVQVYQTQSTENIVCYLFVIVDAILCGTALAIIHLKGALSQYWARDRVACGVLSLVSLVAWLGVAPFYGTQTRRSSEFFERVFYCLVAYACITFGGAVFYGFRSGRVQGSLFNTKGWFSKKSDAKKLQGSDDAVLNTEGTVDGIEGTEDTLPEVPLPENNTDVM